MTKNHGAQEAPGELPNVWTTGCVIKRNRQTASDVESVAAQCRMRWGQMTACTACRFLNSAYFREIRV